MSSNAVLQKEIKELTKRLGLKNFVIAKSNAAMAAQKDELNDATTARKLAIDARIKADELAAEAVKEFDEAADKSAAGDKAVEAETTARALESGVVNKLAAVASATPAKEEPKKSQAKTPDFTVASGKSLTSKRGIIGAGQGISAEQINGDFGDLVKKGYIVDNRKK